MNSKKVLALMMGVIIASSGMSQMAVQVYAHDEESSSSSYSYDDLEGISILDEEDIAAEQLIRMTNFTSKRVNRSWEGRALDVENLFNLYVSPTSNLVFEPTSDTEARLVCLDEEREFNGDIVVPKKVNINGKIYSVTSIGRVAFCDCENIKKVTLPASITRISQSAFSGCRNLQLDALPDDLEIIGTYAFSDCRNLSLEKLPDGLREISDGTFAYCSKLQLENLPRALEIIGVDAFSHCYNLQLTLLPAGLKIIDGRAFEFCERLNLRELPEGLVIIYEGAFMGCLSLRLKSLPTSLREVGSHAFSHCCNLQLGQLPEEGITKIGEGAFEYTGIGTITIPASATELENSAFNTDSIEKINLAQRGRLNDTDI